MFRKAQANSSAFFAVLVLRRCRMKSVKLAERVYRNLQKQQDLLALGPNATPTQRFPSLQFRKNWPPLENGGGQHDEDY